MTGSKCAICGKPQDPKLRPFCSKRCADIDLNRWFSGGYAIPAVEEDDPEEPEERND
ncbi:MAG: DNA gyrase inhibitor YacG [Hyphomonadaceae bacterium]|nr:DNA gyrase inhibitor YacG [Hyphomonadaceae bacterium]